MLAGSASSAAAKNDLPLTALRAAEAQINQIVLGKSAQVRLLLTCVLAGGHVLLEDLPGVGKTTLAHALAATLDLRFGRVQFTSDLLPSDLLGVSIFDQQSRRFEFHPGPIFTQLLLADEINRGTPKLQSALLEAMAEHQVTADGTTHDLPDPFLVIATQNPLEQSGTFPLPESQLDRFLFTLSLGYPDAKMEKELLAGGDRRRMIAAARPLLSGEQLAHLRAAAATVHVSAAAIEYAYALVDATRNASEVRVGLSTRAALGLVRAAQAHALLDGRHHVIPEDLQACFVAVTQHRLVLAAEVTLSRQALCGQILKRVAIP